MYILYSDRVWKYNFMSMELIYPNKMEGKIPLGNIKDILSAFIIIFILSVFSRIIPDRMKEEDFFYVFKNKEKMERHILTQELKR